MATVKRLLSDIDNKIEAEKPAPKADPKPVAKPTAINPANVLKEAKTGKEKTKLDHIKEYFDIWGKPGQSQFDEVVKFYGLGDQDAAELKKHFGYDKPKDSRKELLAQMEGIRNEEKENERNLLKDFGNNAIPYDEFKNKQNKLHQDAQGRVDSLYDQLVGGGKGENKAEATEPAKTKVTKGIVNFDNKDDFLEKNNWSKDFYWDGNDLIDRKTGRDVYTIPNAGAEVPVIANAIIEYKGKQSPATINPRQVFQNANAPKQENDESYTTEQKADMVAKFGKWFLSHEGGVVERLPNGNYMTNIHIGVDEKPVETTPERLAEEYDNNLIGYEPFEQFKEHNLGIKNNGNRINPRQVYENASNAEDALTAKHNQVRAELERKNGRKYSDDEWAAIVELASQLR